MCSKWTRINAIRHMKLDEICISVCQPAHDSFRLDSTHMNIAILKAIPFPHGVDRFRGRNKRIFFGFVVWFYRLMVCLCSRILFFSLFPSSSDSTKDTVRRWCEWATTLLIYLMESALIYIFFFSQSKWCEFIRIEQKYVAKRILENTICNNEGVKVHTMQVVACVDAFWIYSVMLTVHTESPRQSVVIRCLSRNWRCNWRSLSCISEMSWMLSWYLNLSCSNEIRRRVRSTFIRKSTTVWEEEAIVLISFEWPYI